MHVLKWGDMHGFIGVAIQKQKEADSCTCMTLFF